MTVTGYPYDPERERMAVASIIAATTSRHLGDRLPTGAVWDPALRRALAAYRTLPDPKTVTTRVALIGENCLVLLDIDGLETAFEDQPGPDPAFAALQIAILASNYAANPTWRDIARLRYDAWRRRQLERLHDQQRQLTEPLPTIP